MTFHITASINSRIVARAKHFDEGDWVTLTIIEQEGSDGEFNLTVFFSGPDAARKADDYAKAINDVDRQYGMPMARSR